MAKGAAAGCASVAATAATEDMAMKAASAVLRFMRKRQATSRRCKGFQGGKKVKKRGEQKSENVRQGRAGVKKVEGFVQLVV